MKHAHIIIAWKISNIYHRYIYRHIYEYIPLRAYKNSKCISKP